MLKNFQKFKKKTKKMEKLVITQEIAKRMILKKKVANRGASSYPAEHRVSKTTLLWEQPDENGVYQPYRIVNTNYVSPYMQKQINEMFREGDYEGAANKNMSFRATLEQAEELDKVGESVIKTEYKTITTPEGDVEYLRIKSILPVQPEEGDKFTFDVIKEKVEAPVLGEEVVA